MRFLMLTALLICVVSLAYAEPGEKYIDVQHDAHRGVTCWILNDKAISCLPDSQLVAPDRSKAQANPASSPAPRLIPEVFQL